MASLPRPQRRAGRPLASSPTSTTSAWSTWANVGPESPAPARGLGWTNRHCRGGMGTQRMQQVRFVANIEAVIDRGDARDEIRPNPAGERHDCPGYRTSPHSFESSPQTCQEPGSRGGRNAWQEEVENCVETLSPRSGRGRGQCAHQADHTDWLRPAATTSPHPLRCARKHVRGHPAISRRPPLSEEPTWRASSPGTRTRRPRRGCGRSGCRSCRETWSQRSVPGHTGALRRRAHGCD